MKKEDYVDTLVVNGHIVPVGIDDYGQCYYFEYLDEFGSLKETGCGTYNEDYKGYIEDWFATPEQRQNELIHALISDVRDLSRDLYKTQKKLNKLSKKIKK